MPGNSRFDPQRRVCCRGGFDFRVVAEPDSPRLVLQIRNRALRLQACHREGSIDKVFCSGLGGLPTVAHPAVPRISTRAKCPGLG